jgi:hypothetical protein
MGEFVQPNLKSGRFIDAAGLMSTWRGKKVQLRGGRVRVVDGPFTELKEIVGGYTLVEAASDEEAREPARQFVELHRVHRLQARKDVADEPRLIAPRAARCEPRRARRHGPAPECRRRG